MPRMTFTRRETFSAAHRLWQKELSAEENRQCYGKCTNIHGHNYALEVIVTGEVDPKSGALVDLRQLKELIRREIIQKVDHTYLNEDVEFLQGINPTTENLAQAFWNILVSHLGTGTLYALRLHETPNNYVEIRGEE